MKTNLIEDALTVNSNVIVVDEGQFFTDMRATVEKLLAMGKTVIIGGLDGDFRQMPFGELFTLIPLADKVIKLSAICMICRDGTLAPFTKRIVTGTTQEMVGASDKYMAVCRKHLTT
jgi:thymidine kinase